MADIALRGNRLTAAKGGRAALRFGGGRTDLLEELGRVEGERSNPNRRAEISRVHGELNRGYAIGGAVKIGKILGKKGVDYIRKNRKAIRKEVYSPEGTKKAQDMIDKLKRKYPDSQMFGPAKKAAGGRIGRAPGGSAMKHGVKKLFERFGGGEKGKPHSSKEGRIAAGKRNIERMMARRKQWKTPGWQKKPDRKLQPYSPGPRDPRTPKQYSPGPRDPRQPKGWQAVAKGGRIGLKKGGSDKNWIQKAVNPKHKGFCTPMTKKTCTPRRKALARTFKKMGRERKAKG